jgi:hypothetical protein
MVEIVETKKALKKVGIAIAELLIDFTAIAISIVVSLVIPSILPKIMSIPAELAAELVPVAVGGWGRQSGHAHGGGSEGASPEDR